MPTEPEQGAMSNYPYKTKDRVESLIKALETLHQRDPEQEVQGIALPVFDAVVEAIKDDIGRDNPVVGAVAGIISPEIVETGEEIRAADALMMARMLDAEIGRRPLVIA
jgi:hypothetical protein